VRGRRVFGYDTSNNAGAGDLLALLRQSRLYRVRDVCLVRSPFQIREAVVLLNTVAVVHLIATCRLIAEGFSD
jgi:predicted aconitase